MVFVEFRKYAPILAVILLISLILRLAPVLLYGMPISYDAPFHIRHTEMILSSGSIPAVDPAAGSPNSYPPLYHLLLAMLGLLSGVNTEALAALALPVISALLPLAVFIYLRAVGSERNALCAAALVAFASPLIAAAFDSPENVAFLLLPVALLLMRKKKHTQAGLLYASLLLWNYFFVIVTLVPALLAFRRSMKFVACAIGGSMLVILFSLATKGIGFLENQTIMAGMEFTAGNLGGVMPVIAALTLVAAVPILLFAAMEKNRNAKPELAQHKNFFIFWEIISLLALASFVFTPIFRPWEHAKFAALAGIMLLFSLQETKARKLFSVFLAALLLATAIPFTFQVLYPRITELDTHAFRFLEGNYKGGKVLAEPSLSEWLRVRTGLDDALLTSLYFEGGGAEKFASALRWLDGRENGRFLQRNGIGYVLANFEDEEVRGTGWYGNVEGLGKVYEISYSVNCPFPFMPKSTAYACGWNSAALFSLR